MVEATEGSPSYRRIQSSTCNAGAFIRSDPSTMIQPNRGYESRDRLPQPYSDLHRLGQFLDSNVLVVDDSTFGFNADVPFRGLHSYLGLPGRRSLQAR